MNKENAFSSKASLLTRWKNRDKKDEITSQISKIPDNVETPLSREQRRLWFLQQLFPDNPFYNYSELYRLKGDLQIKAFEQSLRLIEQKHDILRATFQVEEGVAIVKTAAGSNAIFDYIDLSNHSYEHASQRADVVIKEHASHTFYLSDESLLRATVVKVAEGDFLFLIVMHHIITDKWSMKIFRKELATYYAALVDGKTPLIDKPEIQYASYAYWQGRQEVNKTHLSYWKQQLSGDIPTLDLPTDYTKKTQPSYKGTFHKQVYSDKTSDAFFDLCKQLETTPYVTMLSIYYVLLQKYAAQEDICIGTPITKRDQTSLEQLIGFFNDTLVLRTKVNPEAPFSTLVQAVKKTTLDAFSNKDISFDTLVTTLKPKRSLNVHPFFQVMFLYHKVPETPTLGDTIEIAYEPYDAGVAKFDLTLYISEDQGSLMSLMEYATDLFEASTIERLHQHFEGILKDVIENPQIHLSDLTLETERDKAFYAALEAPPQAYELPQQGIHDIITARAEKHPEAIALVYKDTKITYQTLNEEATKVALHLRQEGIKKNDIVGLCIERSHDMIIGLLGILKAGAAYLPLDPEYPTERTRYILENAFAKAVLTQKQLFSNFEKAPLKVLGIEHFYKAATPKNVDLPSVENNDLAYVIYTSGSTGVPKGVPISHKNIIHSTLARSEFYSKDPSAFLLMSSISFDSSKAGIYWSLCTGGTLVISEKHLEQDIHKLVDIIDRFAVSHTLMLPSLYMAILAYADNEKLGSLDTVIVAGEACTTQIASLHFETIPAVKLYNEYGPTEATVWCIAYQLNKADGNATSISIGRPIKNVQVYLLDDLGRRVLYGAVGELHIGGLGLSQGYLNDDKKTEQSFIDIPSNGSTSERLYKTGDLARFRPDGNIEFLGRKDQQVKVRGYRIELDEIAELIARNPLVKQAVVTVESDINSLDWDALAGVNAEELLQQVKKYLTATEIKELITSVQSLRQDTIEVVLNNLD